MAYFQKLIKDLRAEILRKEGTTRKYRIISSFKETSMAALQLGFPFFRSFEAVKPKEGRKLNIFGGFDVYNDSLMDYPSIIQSKLSGDWADFNRMISVHVSACPLSCWHCYNDKELHSEKYSVFLSAEEIVKSFLEQRAFDEKTGIKSNVLRITGGEPFLLPEMILETLEFLEKNGFEEKVFLWTETNLIPFIADLNLNFTDIGDILEKLKKYSNLAIHPCFHGTDESNISQITQSKESISLSDLVKGVKSLMEHGLDIYPTVGSNVCNPASLASLFQELYGIQKNLPLRVALIEYDLVRYTPIEKRMADSNITSGIYSKFESLRIWNQLVKDFYGFGYGVIPRHLVPLKNGTFIKHFAKYIVPDSYTAKRDFFYVSKSSYREDYHRELLDILALPKGAIYKIEYDSRHVQKDLGSYIRLRSSEFQDKDGILFYVDQTKEFVIPLRAIKIMKAEMKQDILTLYLQLGSYVGEISKDQFDKMQREIEVYFGTNTIPPGGKYVLFGGCLDILREIRLGDDLETWRETVNNLFEFKCAKFDRSIFYRIDLGKLESKVCYEGIPKFYYEIDNDSKFSITLQYFLPNYDNFDRTDLDIKKIHYETTSDLIKPTGTKEIFVSKYGSEILGFKTDPITGTDVEVTLFFKSLKVPFQAPMVRIPILLKAAKGKMTILAGLSTLFTGFASALVGSAKGLFKDGVLVASSDTLLIFGLLIVVLFVLGGILGRGLLRYKTT